MPSIENRFDILYTWVDDSFPGFIEERRRYAGSPEDVNPERTRDNLDLLKYSLRSIERFAPWRGKVFIVTCRPQVPRWLNIGHPDIRIVYLDEFMPAAELPSYNAFAIESYIHKIESLSERYVHFNDDMLLLREVPRERLAAPDGRLIYYFTQWLPSGARKRKSWMSPHEAGRTNVARALEKTFGPGWYPQQAHHPRIIDKRDMTQLAETFAEAFARTRAARFRAHDTILPHALLSAYLVRSGRAEYRGFLRSSLFMRTVKLTNSVLRNRAALASLKLQRPSFVALNDDFGPAVRESAARVVRRFLEHRYPEPSSFER